MTIGGRERLDTKHLLVADALHGVGSDRVDWNRIALAEKAEGPE